jgi:hypothetical protein
MLLPACVPADTRADAPSDHPATLLLKIACSNKVCVEGPKEKLDTTAVSQVGGSTEWASPAGQRAHAGTASPHVPAQGRGPQAPTGVAGHGRAAGPSGVPPPHPPPRGATHAPTRPWGRTLHSHTQTHPARSLSFLIPPTWPPATINTCHPHMTPHPPPNPAARDLRGQPGSCREGARHGPRSAGRRRRGGGAVAGGVHCPHLCR